MVLQTGKAVLSRAEDGVCVRARERARGVEGMMRLCACISRASVGLFLLTLGELALRQEQWQCMLGGQ